MLIAKGYSASFKMEGGGTVRGAPGAALLHDPTGRTWPSCSGLVLPFRKTRQPLEDAEAAKYFGEGPLRGELVGLPPKALREWRRLGEVREVLYRRTGRHADSFFHPIAEGKRVMLYRRGRALRLELGGGCTWNWRGIVKP